MDNLRRRGYSHPTSHIEYIFRSKGENTMKGKNFILMGLAILTAGVLWAVPVWAAEQDTGYPWFADIEDNQAISQPSTIFRETQVLPAQEDTGYPWFTDTKEDNQAIMKPVTIGVHPRDADKDTGYPWFADTKEDNRAVSQPNKTVQ